MDNVEIRAFLTENMGLLMRPFFVPHSLSRNGKPKNELTPKDLCVNWKIELSNAKGKTALFDYQQGIAHIKGYSQSHNTNRMDWFNVYLEVCERGVHYSLNSKLSVVKPTIEDVVYCLQADADVLNVHTFEEWASEYGYDTDSRKAENLYRECIKQSVEFVSLIGGRLEELHEIYENY